MATLEKPVKKRKRDKRALRMALMQQAIQLMVDIAVQMALRTVRGVPLKEALSRESQALPKRINRRNRVQLRKLDL